MLLLFFCYWSPAKRLYMRLTVFSTTATKKTLVLIREGFCLNIFSVTFRCVKHHDIHGGARGVMVIALGNEHGDTSSNPGRD